MVTNIYWNNYYSSKDQKLYDDLTVEAIKMYGHDVYYMPRVINNYDPVYGADDQSSYENAYLLEMYIKSTSGFTGDGDFYSMIGSEIRPQLVLTVAKRTFQSEVADYTNQSRPNEGDLIYFTMNKRLFQIKSVNKYEFFYQVGQLTTWELTCELFEYSGENIVTGIDEIDSTITNLNNNILDWGILDENDYYLVDENDDYLILGGSPIGTIPGDDTDAIQIEGDDFIDFTQIDPFSEGHI